MKYRYIRKNGNYIWMESLGQAVIDSKTGDTEIVLNCRDITERKQIEEKINYLSYHDTLTGVYNRAYFDDMQKKLIKENKLPLSVIIGDMNGLKLTNDIFGHYEGDNLLINICKVLKESCRKEDIVARWGGDEFVILLPGADEKAVQEIVERIKNNCDKVLDSPIKLSIALGYSTKDNEGKSMKDIIKEAEGVMYRNKFSESIDVRNNILESLEKTLSKKNYTSKELYSIEDYLLKNNERCFGIQYNQELKEEAK